MSSELEQLKKLVAEQGAQIAAMKSAKSDAEKAALAEVEERKAKVRAIRAEAQKLAGPNATHLYYIVGPGGAYSGRRDYAPGSTIRFAADKLPSVEWTPAKPPKALDSVPQASDDSLPPLTASEINKAEAAKPKTGVNAKAARPSDKEV